MLIKNIHNRFIKVFSIYCGHSPLKRDDIQADFSRIYRLLASDHHQKTDENLVCDNKRRYIRALDFCKIYKILDSEHQPRIIKN